MGFDIAGFVGTWSAFYKEQSRLRKERDDQALKVMMANLEKANVESQIKAREAATKLEQESAPYKNLGAYAQASQAFASARSMETRAKTEEETRDSEKRAKAAEATSREVKARVDVATEPEQAAAVDLAVQGQRTAIEKNLTDIQLMRAQIRNLDVNSSINEFTKLEDATKTLQAQTANLDDKDPKSQAVKANVSAMLSELGESYARNRVWNGISIEADRTKRGIEQFEADAKAMGLDPVSAAPQRFNVLTEASGRFMKMYALLMRLPARTKLTDANAAEVVAKIQNISNTIIDKNLEGARAVYKGIREQVKSVQRPFFPNIEEPDAQDKALASMFISDETAQRLGFTSVADAVEALRMLDRLGADSQVAENHIAMEYAKLRKEGTDAALNRDETGLARVNAQALKQFEIANKEAEKLQAAANLAARLDVAIDRYFFVDEKGNQITMKDSDGSVVPLKEYIASNSKKVWDASASMGTDNPRGRTEHLLRHLASMGGKVKYCPTTISIAFSRVPAEQRDDSIIAAEHLKFMTSSILGQSIYQTGKTAQLDLMKVAASMSVKPRVQIGEMRGR